MSVGSATVTVTAEDPGGLRAEQVFGVTVPNRAPVAVGTIAGREVEVDSGATLDVAQYFADPDGQALGYSATSSEPTRATVAVSGSAITVTGVAAGRTTVTVRAEDPGGLWARQSFEVLVPNRAPVAAGTIEDREVYVGDTVALDVAGYFTDPGRRHPDLCCGLCGLDPRLRLDVGEHGDGAGFGRRGCHRNRDGAGPRRDWRPSSAWW